MAEEIGYEWQRVAADIERRIASGELPPGSMLRGERAMAEEYGVAIGTVRRAVKDLRDRGLVVTLAHKGDVARRTANKALRALAAEGLIEVVEGMGYYVRRR